MNLTPLYTRLLTRPEFQQQPPVLVDIGASSGLNPRWAPIARHCIGIAFDADARDFRYVESEASGFKKLIIYNKIVVAENDGAKRDFHLCKNPYCSSLLEPYAERLVDFHYAELFAVERKIPLETVDLPRVLREQNLTKIDWFKVDSQGIDLRLFRSLPPEVQANSVVLEFEPGLSDTYRGEDKLGPVLNHLEQLGRYFFYEFRVKTAVRLPAELAKDVFPESWGDKRLHYTVPPVPSWTEIGLMNRLDGPAPLREYLLAWIFAMVNEHPELAYVYARKGAQHHQDPILGELADTARAALRRRLWRPSHLWRIACGACGKLRRKLGGA